MLLLYIIGAILGLILLILLIRVRIIFSYSEKLTLKVGALFINYDVLKKRPEKAKKTKKKKQKKKVSEQTSAVGKDNVKKKNVLKEFTEDMDIGDFLDLISAFFTSLGKMLSNHLYVRLNKFRIIVGGEDPAKSALQFGALCQSCSYLFEILRNNTKLYPLEKSEVSVLHDFSKKKSEYELTITVKLRIIHVFCMLLSVLLEFFKIKESKTKPKGKK